MFFVSEEKIIIGLEIHTYLNTKTKLLCGCSTQQKKEPNTSCCPICLGHPGSKPVMNEKAIELAAKIGLALDCELNREFFFSRKTYFYPDLASNYQITQNETPIAKKGFLLVNGKKIRIRRAHIENDPAAIIHPNGIKESSYCLVDYNRSGLPLVEIVTEPDLKNAKEAREFLNALENTLSYLDVIMPDTTLKIDCNISINGGARVEIKNVSGFAAAEKALNFEILRQKRELRMNKKIEQHTRIFNSETGMTVMARKKETEEDYGYIFEPDLVKIVLEEDEIQRIKESMPELPQQRIQRLVKTYGITENESIVLCSQKKLAELFEQTAKKTNPKIASKIFTREILAILNHDSLSLKDVEINVEKICELVQLLDEKKVSDKNAKQSLINYISGDKTPPKEFLEKNNLLISEKINLEEIIQQVLDENKSAVEDYKNGNKKSFNFLFGIIMKKTMGKASPEEVKEKLLTKL